MAKDARQISSSNDGNELTLLWEALLNIYFSKILLLKLSHYDILQQTSARAVARLA